MEPSDGDGEGEVRLRRRIAKRCPTCGQKVRLGDVWDAHVTLCASLQACFEIGGDDDDWSEAEADGPAFVDCPLCNACVDASLIDRHADVCCNERSLGADAAPALLPLPPPPPSSLLDACERVVFRCIESRNADVGAAMRAAYVLWLTSLGSKSAARTGAALRAGRIAASLLHRRECGAILRSAPWKETEAGFGANAPARRWILSLWLYSLFDAGCVARRDLRNARASEVFLEHADRDLAAAWAAAFDLDRMDAFVSAACGWLSPAGQPVARSLCVDGIAALGLGELWKSAEFIARAPSERAEMIVACMRVAAGTSVVVV